MKIKIIFLVVFLGAVAGWFFLPKTPANIPTYKQVMLTKTTMRSTVSATGTVEPQNRLEIKPQVAGRLENVLVQEGDSVKKGDVLAWVSSTERAALLDAARMQSKETIAYWENVYKTTPLISPIAGTVIVRSLEPGQTVGTDTPVVVLSDRLVVNAQIDETDIGKVRIGQKVEITLDAYPEEVILGTVSHIAYESTVVSNVTIYQVKIAPQIFNRKFRSGMGANVNIVENEATVSTLPLDAVTTNAQGSFVLVEQTAQPPKLYKVTLGQADEKRVEIVSGISATDKVLVKDNTLVLSTKKRSSSPFMPSRSKTSKAVSGAGAPP
jgi:membrane fusion protein, macrolide-specific efflux system